MGLGTFLFGSAGNAMGDAQRRQRDLDQSLTGQVNQAITPYQQMAQQGNVGNIFSQYLQEAQSQDPTRYAVQPQDMQYQDPLQNVNRYLDPSLQFQMDAARRGVEASAAGRGGLFSGAAGNQIAQNTQQIAQQGWGDAYNRAEQARQGQLGVAQQNFANRLQGGQFNLGLDQTRLQNLGGALEAGYQPLNMATQAQLDMASQRYGTQSGMNQQAMQGQMADRGMFGDILGAGANIFSGYLSGRNNGKKQ
jgi:hypothetical protein